MSLAFLLSGEASTSRSLPAGSLKLPFLFDEGFDDPFGDAVTLLGLLSTEVGGDERGEDSEDDGGLVGVGLDSGVWGR